MNGYENSVSLKHNIQGRLRNLCYRGKEISITCYEWQKEVNTEYLHPDRCLSHSATLLTNKYDGILLKEYNLYQGISVSHTIN
jgi:hypothetical protein